MLVALICSIGAPSLGLRGRVQSPVEASRLPVRMSTLWWYIWTLVLSKWTVQLASTRVPTEIRGCDERSGTWYAARASRGSWGRSMSPWWVAYMMAPLGLAMGIGVSKARTLVSLASIGKKLDVAPESSTPCLVVMDDEGGPVITFFKEVLNLLQRSLTFECGSTGSRRFQGRARTGLILIKRHPLSMLKMVAVFSCPSLGFLHVSDVCWDKKLMPCEWQ